MSHLSVRRAAVWFHGVWIALLLPAVGCRVDPQADPVEVMCVGPNCFTEDAAAPVDQLTSDATVAAPVKPDAEAGPIDLCPGECLPDDPMACSSEMAPEAMQLSYRPRSLDSAPLKLTLDAGLSLLAAEAGAVSSMDAGSISFDAGDINPLPSAPEFDSAAETPAEVFDAAPEGDAEAGGDGGYKSSLDTIVPPEVDSSYKPPALPTAAGCQLFPESNGGVRARCDIAGVGEEGSSCISSADCEPGLACVSDASGVGGTCMSYCCHGDQSCSVDRFCSRRPLKTAVATEKPVMVPVCAPSEQCDLMDPYPCPDDNCKCPSGLACAPVGKDGARRCVAPGISTEGEACPCAAGYFCTATNVCLKVCQFGTSDCGDDVCQPLGGFPDQWGLCVEVPVPGAGR